MLLRMRAASKKAVQGSVPSRESPRLLWADTIQSFGAQCPLPGWPTPAISSPCSQNFRVLYFWAWEHPPSSWLSSVSAMSYILAPLALKPSDCQFSASAMHEPIPFPNYVPCLSVCPIGSVSREYSLNSPFCNEYEILTALGLGQEHFGEAIIRQRSATVT